VAGVLVTIGIGQWQEVPVDAAHRFISPALPLSLTLALWPDPEMGQLGYGVGQGGGTQPIPCLQSRIHEYRPVVRIAVGDP